MTEKKAPRGRPKRQRAQVMRTVRIDTEIDAQIEAISENTGIPYGRLINLVMRQYVESVEAGSAIPIINWPTVKGANDAR